MSGPVAIITIPSFGISVISSLRTVISGMIAQPARHFSGETVAIDGKSSASRNGIAISRS